MESQLGEIIDELRVRGVRLVKYPNIKNYWISEIPEENVGAIHELLLQKSEEILLLLSRISSPVLRTQFGIDSINVLIPSGFITYEKSPVSIVLEPTAKFGENDVWPKEKFKDKFAADYKRAFIRFANPKFSGIFGRERFALGPSPRYNLLLSGYSPPLDGGFLSYEEEKFKLSFVFSRLEDIKGEILNFVGDTVHTDTANSSRFISIRRIDFLPKDWINVGLSELAIYGGPDGFPSLYYLNPIAMSYPYEYVHSDANHNIFWDIDFKLDLRNFSLYGEFLMDDFQYGKDEQGEPNHIGFLMGMELADPLKLKNTFLWIEYARTTRWVYNHFVPWQRYEYLDYPMGHPQGPDFDELFAKITHHLNPEWDFYGKFSYTRHGAGKIDDVWPIPESPRDTTTYFPENNFLLSPVDTYFDLRTGINFFKMIRFRNLKIAATVSGEVGFCKPSYKDYFPVFKASVTLGSLI